MSRILLVLPRSTYRAPDFMAAARAVGAEIVVASEAPQALAGIMDDRYVRIDLRDPMASAARMVDRAPLDAIMPVDDGGVEVAAIAAERLGLAHNPPIAVAATRNKAEMRAQLARAGVAQPAYRVLEPHHNVIETGSDLGFPVVVKPLSLSASRGVIRADDAPQLTEAVNRIRNILEDSGRDRSEQLLIEEYLPGDEVAVEAMLQNGTLHVLAILDKPDPLVGPYFEETIFVTPSRHSVEVEQAITDTVADAVKALGLAEGPIHAEMRLSRGEVRMLEIAARPIGGLCGRALAFGLLGATLEQVLLRNALRLPQAGLQAQAPAAGAMMLPIPSRGRLGDVSNLDEALSIPGITGIEITVPRGEMVVPLPEGDRYLGFVFSRGLTAADAETSLRRASDTLEIHIDA
jgi:biotin carboxylase